MNKKKTIPCRVCGKHFEPCAYCQSHADVFRWRNFACSKECAMKYINDTIAYRNAKRNENGQKTLQEELKNDSVITPKRKRQKQISNDSILNQIDFVRDYKDELLEGDENE